MGTMADSNKPKAATKLVATKSLNGMSLLDELHEIDSWGMQAFWEKDYEGSCPCFHGSRKENGKTVNVAGRCWRVSDNAQDLYAWGDHPKLKTIAKTVKRALDAQEWYNHYTIIYEEFA